MVIVANWQTDFFLISVQVSDEAKSEVTRCWLAGVVRSERRKNRGEKEEPEDGKGKPKTPKNTTLIQHQQPPGTMTKRVSILCFGNSLTAGYYQFGLDYHPYAWKLESRLKTAFPSHTFLVNAEGLPGDLAIGPPGRFLPRIQEKCMSIFITDLILSIYYFIISLFHYFTARLQ